MSKVIIFGDVHGHLQLVFGLAYLAREELGEPPEALLLCGDVGVFPDLSKVDKATRKHAQREPLELDFAYQWARLPWPPWLEAIFSPEGLGLETPAVMVHGNHEDFEFLARLLPPKPEAFPVGLEDLPSVDPKGKVKYLPSGWVLELPSGLRVAGLGGIEPSKRFRPLKNFTEREISDLLALVDSLKPHILITHQGPARLHGTRGSQLLDPFLGKVGLWFHGHARSAFEPAQIEGTTVYPLADFTFVKANLPPPDSWALVEFSGAPKVVEFYPEGLWELTRERWLKARWGGREVAIMPLLGGWV